MVTAIKFINDKDELVSADLDQNIFIIKFIKRFFLWECKEELLMNQLAGTVTNISVLKNT